MGVSSSVVNLYPSLAALTPAQFDALAGAAASWTDRHLGRNIMAGTYTETFSGMNNPILFLKSTPVLNVPQVVVSSYSNSNTYTPASNYYSWTTDGQLHINPQGFWNQLPGWRPGVGNVVVTYESGGLPQPEIDLIVGAVMNWWTQQNNKSVLMSSETIMSYSYQMRTDINSVPPAVTTVMYPYYKFTVG